MAKRVKKETHYRFRIGNVLHVVYFGTTGNRKIAPKGEKIGQSAHYSRSQYEAVGNVSMGEFFDLDADNCIDCPLQGANGDCYTHKFGQYRGFKSQLMATRKRFPTWDSIPELTAEMAESIARQASGKFFRFGSYGEPSLLPTWLIADVCQSARTWTGYTHQWHKQPELAQFFMASTHTMRMAETAKRVADWRSFVAVDERPEGGVNCPASAEGGYKSTCSKCGLCSGTLGKGKTSVWILNHGPKSGK